ncbi:MAG: alanine dehydrogenase [Alphaproteobacteria bacterium]|nr:MAG: alanine dehydrogenase [Alphaproteobacteria bacterium]
MFIGVPKEIKPQENRVGLNPESVHALVKAGHSVVVETNAGQGIMASDDEYRSVGATIAKHADAVFESADMIVKVKEPQPIECQKLREGQILFTYLHLAPDPEQAKGLMESGCVAIAYETVTGEGARDLPLLRPMSEVAGRMAPLMGAVYSAKHFGGRGQLVSGVTGAPPTNILILGGGVSGFAAAQMAVGMGANVTITDMDDDRLSFLNDHFDGKARTAKASEYDLVKELPHFDMVVGAVLIPGASAPQLISRAMLKIMKPSAMLVDIAIDQGGCFETSRPTTHNDPVYEVDGIQHYCVANMPGAYPLTSTAALNNATLPYVLAIADKGWERALSDDFGLSQGLNVKNGKIVHAAVKSALNL